ncbi:MAG: acyl carrier protein [Acidimicrobiales bacterium]
MENQDIFDAVKARALEVLDVEPDLITPEAGLADTLGADSVHLLEIAGQLEAQFGVELEDRELYDVVTIGELVDLVARKR